MSKKYWLIGGGVVVVVIGILWGWMSSQDRATSPVAVPVALPHVTLGIQTSPAMALVMVAKDKGFFAKEGLDVELKEFAAGKDALQAFLGNSLDFSVSGDVPVALATVAGNALVIPAQVVGETRNEVRVVARKDGDLSTAREYFAAKKRRIATSIGGGPEFFTYEFLKKIGITKDQVEIVSQKPGDMPAALSNGSVDAIAIFDPFAYIAERELGDQAITFTDSRVYSELYVLAAKTTVKQDSSTLDKLLRGLRAAEVYTRTQPEDAKLVVMKYTKLDRATLDGIWSSFDFRIALTPQLREYLEREVAWAKEKGTVDASILTPDFHTIIYDAPLKRLESQSVEGTL